MEGASVPSPSLTTALRLRGKLTLLNVERRGSSTIALFPYRVLPVAFRDVCVENCTSKTPRLLKDLFVACKEMVTHVNIDKLEYLRKVLKLVDIYMGQFQLVPADAYMSLKSHTPLIDLSPHVARWLDWRNSPNCNLK